MLNLATDTVKRSLTPQFEESLAIRTGDDFVVDAQNLHSILDSYDTLIVDLRSDIASEEGYIPGAVHLDYAELVRQAGLAEGLAPTPQKISAVLSAIGLQPWHNVIAYDDETGVEAARLLWTLSAVGHSRYALLDGGYQSWVDADLEVASLPRKAKRSQYTVSSYNGALVDKNYVLASLGSLETVLVDTRGSGEFSGEERRAEKGGHIPGAVNFNWMEAVDMFGDGGLRPADKLLAEFRDKGVTPDKEVIVYCQSNRRSAHTFLVLKWLGFENVKAYDGSWSEWGNDPALPVAA